MKPTTGLGWCPHLTCDAGPFEDAIALHEHLYDDHGVPRPRVRFGCRAEDCTQRPFESEADRDLHEIAEHGSLVEVTPKTARGGMVLQPGTREPGAFVCGVDGCLTAFSHKGVRGRHRNTEHEGWSASSVDLSVLTSHEAAGLQRGRDERAAKERQPSKEAGTEGEQMATEEFECTEPGCDRRFAAEQGRRMHITRAHRGLGHVGRPSSGAGKKTTRKASPRTEPVPAAVVAAETPTDVIAGRGGGISRAEVEDAEGANSGEMPTLELAPLGQLVTLSPEQVDVVDAAAFLRREEPGATLQRILDEALAEVADHAQVRTLVRVRAARDEDEAAS